ncbi:MAG: glutamate--tRNA ligase [Bacteriovoracaceae bacterium]
MSVRVRFAPSPTGYLHIGGARTALYNYLFAKATGGTFVLRIEDTDEERSKREYEELQIDDLKWLGLDYDEGPGKEGDCGPYRQSERKLIYQKKAAELVEKKLAFHCFCTEEELEAKKAVAMAANLDPKYDGTCRHLSSEEIAAKKAKGLTSAIRFKAYEKSYTLHDHVRGDVVFPEGMVGDFIILRSDGGAVYNFCCVVDDTMMRITHVIRGEDHLSNTLRQLMIYEAFGAKLPEFAHVSLLVGADRQKLSKRHGATSLHFYREASYLPSAICNYLCLLGWSHPTEKDIFTLDEIGTLFDIKRFSKSPAVFDVTKFEFINGQHLRALPIDELGNRIKDSIQLTVSTLNRMRIGSELS